eukprot:m.54049 g.54049  ORF g.54049 m.54049 type:complete len:60 (-) comp11385_c0_seq5:1213-1392(-)
MFVRTFSEKLAAAGVRVPKPYFTRIDMEQPFPQHDFTSVVEYLDKYTQFKHLVRHVMVI